jgi:transcriptional regulator with XRE-family HTH domain
MTTTKAESLGKRVAAIRKRKGLSLRDVATAGGLSHVSVHKIESGVTPSPGLEVLRSLARGLGVTLASLVKP